MREIKFRGKSVTAGDFIYGDFLQINNKTYIYPDIHGDLDDIDFGHTYIEVIPETVGQFTGLYDKNGKEIYEGDILRYGTSPYYIVNFQRGRWNISYFADGNGDNLPIISGNQEHNKFMEIVGNIHENNNLLENK